jgi:hypothetical protein
MGLMNKQKSNKLIGGNTALWSPDISDKVYMISFATQFFTMFITILLFSYYSNNYIGYKQNSWESWITISTAFITICYYGYKYQNENTDMTQDPLLLLPLSYILFFIVDLIAFEKRSGDLSKGSNPECSSNLTNKTKYEAKMSANKTFRSLNYARFWILTTMVAIIVFLSASLFFISINFQKETLTGILLDNKTVPWILLGIMISLGISVSAVTHNIDAEDIC